MTSDELKNLAAEATTVIAGIPALAPYLAPISMGLAVAAAVAPPIYEEIKILFARVSSGAQIPDEDVARLHQLIAALKSPDDYFNEGHAVGVASVAAPGPVTAPQELPPVAAPAPVIATAELPPVAAPAPVIATAELPPVAAPETNQQPTPTP